MVEQWTRDQLRAYVEQKYEDQAPDVMRLVSRWIDRGDGVAVYENQLLGHPEMGSPKITSFGSAAAMLEPECETCRDKLGPADETSDPASRENGWVHLITGLVGHVPVYPPQWLPDIGNQINWRYQLIATHRRENG